MAKKNGKWAQAATKAMKKSGTTGSLTRIAKAHGMQPLAFAKLVMNNPKNYSSAVVKKANFAKNINK
jgi:hypothetical protein